MKTKLNVSAALFILVATLSAGCVPTRTFVRTSASFGQVMPRVSSVGIINDVVLARDAIGTNDYFCIEDSRTAASLMLSGAKAHLAKKGYKVDYASTPFVGSFKNPDLRMAVADTHKGAVSRRYSPFSVSAEMSQDATYQQALIKVLRRMLMAVEQKTDSPSDVFRRDPTVQENLKTVAERTKADFILFVVGNGTVVSRGKQIGQDIATGLLTGVLSLGTVVHTSHNISFLDSFVALVDLRNTEIVWSNSFRLRELSPLKEGTYSGAWAKSLLYPFPARGAGNEEHKSEPRPTATKATQRRH